MNTLLNTFGFIFTIDSKLWPPILTGCVTISIFLFTIWKDKIKEKRKKRRDNSQKNIYLLNLLNDAGQHIQDQIKSNEVMIAQLCKEPTKYYMLNYMPVYYLERLSAVLANDGYFAAFNSEYNKIEEHNRIRIYNDLAIDIDLFYSSLKELYTSIERAGKFYEDFKSRYFEAGKTVVKQLSAFHIMLENTEEDDIDCDMLCSKLNKLPFNEFVEAMNTQDLSYMNDEFIRPAHDLLTSFLIPHFPFMKTVMLLCQDCQNATQEYYSLVNTNKSLEETVDAINVMLQDTLSSFYSKLGQLEGKQHI